VARLDLEAIEHALRLVTPMAEEAQTTSRALRQARAT
jgi:hypothetical protein